MALVAVRNMVTGFPDDPVNACPWAKSACMTMGVEIIPTTITIVPRMAPVNVSRGEYSASLIDCGLALTALRKSCQTESAVRLVMAKPTGHAWIDRKSTRLNSSHLVISYA